MGRIRQLPNESKFEEHPMVIKKEEERDDTNGLIPVLFEDATVYFDTRNKTYFAAIKIDGKKYRFEMVKWLLAQSWKDSYIVTCKKEEDINCRGPQCFYFKTCWRGIFKAW